MSSPATSCSRRYTDNASTYCSRNRLITIASRNDFRLKFSVYQLGRGNDPVIVVGNTSPFVAFNMGQSLLTLRAAASRGERRSGIIIECGALRRRFPNGTTLEA